ncbi:SemiSWEET transporter [Vogesella sp. LIG4]|uniref:SemiSWEET transporter n=1 Tax=Vogesella sp. LIG4 TaxID=1192162 RepID=UPI00081FAAC4|nr:SemiSWEET transporter [Vogesella sp. LIG4]SCK21438.1 MtN3 and saliva related transmembrane protein [Vogesella sp. LIG4]
MTMEQLGYIAALLTTGSFLPQVLHTLKSRDTRSISLAMYLMFVAGTVLWLLYGWSINSLPVVAANFITLLLSSIILAMKLRQVSRDRG